MTISNLGLQYHTIFVGKARPCLTLVQPQPEYAVEAWNTYNINSTDRHEHIQRAASRFVHNDCRHKTSVCNLIDILDWDHIHTMRLVSHLTMFYEIHYYLVIIHMPQLVSLATFIGKHDNQLKYAIAVATMDSCKFSFYPRLIRLCYQLPSLAGF